MDDDVAGAQDLDAVFAVGAGVGDRQVRQNHVGDVGDVSEVPRSPTLGKTVGAQNSTAFPEQPASTRKKNNFKILHLINLSFIFSILTHLF